jgi:hypothetical protein
VQDGGRALPVRAVGDKTRALVFDAHGVPLDQNPIVSGTDPANLAGLSLRAKERRAQSLLSHVESTAAARIRRGELPRETVLVINNLPCQGEMGCETYLSSILPARSRLAIYVADGQATRLYRVFEGDGSKIAS